MNEKRIALLILVFLSFSSLPLALFIVAEPAFVIPDYEPVEWQSGDAGEAVLPKFDPTIDFSGVIGGSSKESGLAMATPPVETVVNDWYCYSLSGGIDPTMTLRAVGEFVEVWVQNDLSFPAGDARNLEPWRWQITDDMAQYLADEFDNTIYARDTEYFGVPDDRDGTDTIFEAYNYPASFWDWIETTDPDNPQRVILKIINYRDTNYYNASYPSYVAGFFSSTYTDYYQRNMVHLDCWEWCERLGPEGYQWLPDEHPEIVVDRPNLYESTLAHEFQHLIHRDYVESPPTFMNEACSLFAEPMCGYALDAGQIEWFLATPDNSLTEWGDQGDINILADYGSSFLWALYLTDHYGIDFMGRYVKNGGGGIEGINALLPKGKNFDKVYHDWRIANLLQFDHGKYGYSLRNLRKYYNPDVELNFDELEPLKVHQVSGPDDVEWTSAVTAFGETITKGTDNKPEGYSTGIYKLDAYSTDYINFSNFDGDVKFSFDGDDDGEILLEPYESWTNEGSVSDYFWWSGNADLKNSIIATPIPVEVPTDNPVLELYTYWDIEDYWDFGFVQVSPTGNWDDWTSLTNEYTTDEHDSSAHPYVLDNLPGLTGMSYYWFDDFDFHWITFDLSDYAGETIYIGFRWVTDWLTTYDGWFLDEILVKGDGVADLDIGGDLQIFYPPNPEADFIVDLVRFEEHHGKIKFDGIFQLKLNDLTEIGSKWVDLDHNEFFIAVVSTDTGLVDYQFSVMEKYTYHYHRRHCHRNHCCR